MTKTATTKTTTCYELTWTLNGKPAGFGGYYATREEAEAARAKGKLSGKIKRVRGCRVEHHCDSGEATGERCQWTGNASELTEVEYMPEQHRASHEAAGNRGVYPANGAIRIHVCPACCESLVDDDWCTEV